MESWVKIYRKSWETLGKQFAEEYEYPSFSLRYELRYELKEL